MSSPDSYIRASLVVSLCPPHPCVPVPILASLTAKGSLLEPKPDQVCLLLPNPFSTKAKLCTSYLPHHFPQFLSPLVTQILPHWPSYCSWNPQITPPAQEPLSCCSPCLEYSFSRYSVTFSFISFRPLLKFTFLGNHIPDPHHDYLILILLPFFHCEVHRKHIP